MSLQTLQPIQINFKWTGQAQTTIVYLTSSDKAIKTQFLNNYIPTFFSSFNRQQWGIRFHNASPKKKLNLHTSNFYDSESSSIDNCIIMIIFQAFLLINMKDFSLRLYLIQFLILKNIKTRQFYRTLRIYLHIITAGKK